MACSPPHKLLPLYWCEMSKLSELQDWLTVEETARYLTKKLKSETTAATLYRLALEGRITLSLNLPQAELARPIVLCPLDEENISPIRVDNSHSINLDFEIDLDEEEEFISEQPSHLFRDIPTPNGLSHMQPKLGYDVIPTSICFNTWQSIGQLESWEPLSGVVDLPLLSNEELLVKNLLQIELGLAEIEISNTPILVQPENSSDYYQLFRSVSENDDGLGDCIQHIPFTQFPDTSQIVIRQSHINQFLMHANSVETAQPESHLLLISALLSLLKDELKKTDPRISQEAILNKIRDTFPEIRRGFSYSNLTKLFSNANTAFKEAQKDSFD